MQMRIIPYAGWDQCVQLSNDTVELIVTKQVGPRIIRFALEDSPNEFVEYADQTGKTAGPVYRSYGGHRLWVAPETAGWTNHPDNGPVDITESGGEIHFTAAPEKGTGLRKCISVTLPETGPHVQVRHRITNTGAADVSCALWALSVMAPGGTAIVPQEPFIPHSDKVLPARPMVLWHYADMTDARWTWGKKFIRLRQSPAADTPQKIGVRTTAGWAAYANRGRLFIKHFPFDASAAYPDFGCNAEIFTNQKMLEVESLGPLAPLRPGETRDHVERWSLFHPGPIPKNDEDLEELLNNLLP